MSTHAFQPEAGVSAPAPVTAAGQPNALDTVQPKWYQTQHPNAHLQITDGRPRTRLECALRDVVAAVHATEQYAKSIGYAMPRFTSEDLRSLANTILTGGRNGH